MKNLLLFAFLIGAVCPATNAIEPAPAERLDAVVERGVHVMPFNLDKTLHIFNKTDSGGIQQVIAKNTEDNEQISLIRQHLAGIAAHFAQGDFSGPQRIHGNDMPGVKELASAAGRVQFNYHDLPNGGQIDYVTTEPELIAAIHRYFDAQLRDHARHAISGDHALHHGHQP
ncbi:MAG: aspartate carbamoyltransferase [Methylovulum sp.]|nr:aspartate carbamoyltransferase [Methylovulum sp.]